MAAKSGLASQCLRLISNGPLSLATTLHRWIADNRSSDLHHNENRRIGQKNYTHTQLSSTHASTQCHLSSVPNAQPRWVLKFAMNYLCDELSLFLAS